MTAHLYTRDGALVRTFKMPPFAMLPEVAVWGSRIFILRDPFITRQAKEPEYYEACAWSLDASTVVAKDPAS